jgi:hypothetical protein
LTHPNLKTQMRCASDFPYHSLRFALLPENVHFLFLAVLVANRRQRTDEQIVTETWP